MPPSKQTILWIITVVVLSALLVAFVALFGVSAEDGFPSSKRKLWISNLFEKWNLIPKDIQTSVNTTDKIQRRLEVVMLHTFMDDTMKFISQKPNHTELKSKWIVGPTAPTGRSWYNPSLLGDNTYIFRNDDIDDIYETKAHYMYGSIDEDIDLSTIEPKRITFVDNTNLPIDIPRSRGSTTADSPVFEDIRPVHVIPVSRIPEWAGNFTQVTSKHTHMASCSLHIRNPKFTVTQGLLEWNENGVFKLLDQPRVEDQNLVERNWIFFRFSGMFPIFFVYSIVPEFKIYKYSRDNNVSKCIFKSTFQIPKKWGEYINMQDGLRLTCMTHASGTNELMFIFHHRDKETSVYTHLCAYLDVTNMKWTRFSMHPVFQEFKVSQPYVMHIDQTKTELRVFAGVSDIVNGVRVYDRKEWEERLLNF